MLEPIRLRLMLLMWLAVCLHVSPAEAGRKYALVVGVKTYRPNQKLPSLQYTENDAIELAAVLRDGGYQVTVMTQTIARTEGKEVLNPLSDYIRDQLDALIGSPSLGSDDVVIVALSGHGVQFDRIEKLPDGTEKKAPKFYFCPADAAISGVTTADDVTARNRLIDVDELYATLQASKAGGKLLLVDACRNDPRGIRSRSLMRPRISDPPGGTVAFFSCSENEVAREDSTLRNGVFFHYVVEALNGAADTSTPFRPADRRITLSELKEHVSISVYDFVRDEYPGAKQTPEFKGNVRLTFPLIELRNEAGRGAAGIEFVRIRPGAFRRGSDRGDEDERPIRTITISKPFYAGKFEVTIGQILTWLNTPGVRLKEEWIDLTARECPVRKVGTRFMLNTRTEFATSARQPMQNIGWEGAVAFCEWCTKQDSQFRYRLPTEAEWEYIARAGSTTAFPWGDSLNGTRANVNGNYPARAPRGPFLQRTTEVGKYRPNAWGLYDTVGNVYEWCSDWHDPGYYAVSAATDPQGPSGPGRESRVLRGGSWTDHTWGARSSNRLVTDDGRENRIGFRVVAEKVR